PRTLRWRDSRWRPAGVVGRAHAAAREPQDVDDLPKLCAVAAHDRRREHRLWTAVTQTRPRHHCEKARGDPGHDQARNPGPALSRRVVGWAAAARRAGPRAGGRTGNPAAG